MAALIVDKDVEALSDLADRFVVIAKGEVVYTGESAALTSDRDSIVRHLAI
jgi:branched-chain amino acid transport system ATP-binding protein